MDPSIGRSGILFAHAAVAKMPAETFKNCRRDKYIAIMPRNSDRFCDVALKRIPIRGS